MSSRSDNKMYNYEVIPPAKLWDKIAADLDDSEFSHTFPATLYGAEVTAPAAAWDKIAAALDQSEPAYSFPSKLYRYEVVPPAVAWEKIKASLGETTEEAIPERRRLFPWVRYAAAAAIIGVVAFGSIQLLKKKGPEKGIAIKEVNIPVNNQPVDKIKDTAVINNIDIAITDEARDNAALEASKGTVAKLDIPVRSKMKTMAGNYFLDPVDLDANTKEISPDATYRELDYAGGIQAALNNQETKTNIADRYIMLMTPDGNIIRMSKKLGDLVCCVSGADQDNDCKDQMKKWREKIAGSSKATAPGNVMDLLDLVKSLQENNL